MKLVVNGELQEVPAATLAEALQSLDFADAKVATALNGEFVPARARVATLVKDGDRIEIYRPLVEEPKLARRKRVGRSG